MTQGSTKLKGNTEKKTEGIQVAYIPKNNVKDSVLCLLFLISAFEF